MLAPGNHISYPLDRTKPADGATLEVAPGVHWLRMPLPFVLNHINLWLLADGDGWTLVDTGIRSRKTQEIWEQVLQRDIGGKPVRRIIVTHLHPDHAGLAGWLCERLGAELWMTREEYLLARVLASDRPPPPESARQFFQAAGMTAEQLERYASHYGQYAQVVSDLPLSYRRLQQDEELQIGANRWRVVIGRGHSPEHACLYCESLGLLIAGDQVLPTISPNIGVWPTEPHANPLADWLESCRRLPVQIPDSVLVLPAHGRPFHGLKPRLAALIEEHESGLQRLRGLCAEPKRVVDVFEALFRGAVTSGNLIMAIGESVAHLRYLQAENEVTVKRDANGVDWYQSQRTY